MEDGGADEAGGADDTCSDEADGAEDGGRDDAVDDACLSAGFTAGGFAFDDTMLLTISDTVEEFSWLDSDSDEDGTSDDGGSEEGAEELSDEVIVDVTGGSDETVSGFLSAKLTVHEVSPITVAIATNADRSLFFFICLPFFIL